MAQPTILTHYRIPARTGRWAKEPYCRPGQSTDRGLRALALHTRKALQQLVTCGAATVTVWLGPAGAVTKGTLHRATAPGEPASDDLQGVCAGRLVRKLAAKPLTPSHLQNRISGPATGGRHDRSRGDNRTATDVERPPALVCVRGAVQSLSTARSQLAQRHVGNVECHNFVSRISGLIETEGRGSRRAIQSSPLIVARGGRVARDPLPCSNGRPRPLPPIADADVDPRRLVG